MQVAIRETHAAGLDLAISMSAGCHDVSSGATA
jgi:hypothetical protein